MPFLLAERARSECARSTRAVKGSLGHSSKKSLEEEKGAVEDQSAPIRGRRTGKLGRIIYGLLMRRRVADGCDGAS